MGKENIVWGKNFPSELMEKWPKNKNNEYIEAVFLKTCYQCGMEDKILMGILESAGIPSFTKLTHYGGFANLIIGQSGEGIDIYVPKTQFEDAVKIINQDMEDYEI